MAVSAVLEGDLAHVMEQMPYGMYIIGSADSLAVPNGMMADWVMQVSFEPRLVAVSFENDAHTLANIRSHGWFTVNLLPEDEEARKLASKFAQPYEDAKVLGRPHVEGMTHPKMDSVPHITSQNGCPILEGALSWMECRATEFSPVGDHTLVIAQVLGGNVIVQANPMTSTYTGWNYSG